MVILILIRWRDLSSFLRNLAKCGCLHRYDYYSEIS